MQGGRVWGVMSGARPGPGPATNITAVAVAVAATNIAASRARAGGRVARIVLGVNICREIILYPV